MMIIPPFSSSWVEQMEAIGHLPTDELKQRLVDLSPEVAQCSDGRWSPIRRSGPSAGGGVVLMGL